MSKEDTKAMLLEIVALIHTFGGGILLGAFTIIQASPAKLMTNPIATYFLLVGLGFFFYNFFVIENTYDNRSGKIIYAKLRHAFETSIFTMVFLMISIFLLMLS